MAQVTVTFVLDSASADKFGMKVVKVEKPEGFEITGKLAWMLKEHGHFPLKKLHSGAAKPKAEAPAGIDPAMFAQFQAFMAMQSGNAPAAAQATTTKKPARAKKVA